VDANIRLNGIAGVASFLPLNWGSLDLLDLAETLRGIDVILAADCFYQSEGLLWRTVCTLSSGNPSDEVARFT
jgi:hypothetical protein